MAKKKSFLERLTGVSSSNDITVKKGNYREQVIHKDFTTQPMPEENQKQKKKEDWLSESEGQLTIDVYQTHNDIVIKSTIAGVKPEDIDVAITNDMVTIKGKRQKDEEVKTEEYYYQECYWGSFSRSVILPVEVDSDSAQASMKNGILTIRLPKIEKTKTKKLKVKPE